MKTETFIQRTPLAATAAEVFGWHERPGGLDRLIPPWEDVCVVSRGQGVGNGARVELLQRLGPLRLRWVAEHRGCQTGREFRDVQVSGPFAYWEHTHRFEPRDEGGSLLEDRIEYALPGGWVGHFLGKRLVAGKLRRMFRYRHDVTRDDLAAVSRYGESNTMQIAVTGSHGLLGSTLVPMLSTAGHQVTRLVRGQPAAGEVRWDPDGETTDLAPLEGVQAVVHLAGENIAAARWTAATKQRIRDSRVQGTRRLSEALAELATRPQVLISASAIGYYGDRGEELLDEQSPAGSGFLADLAELWEAAAQPARDAGIRTVHLRFGVILSPRGGALAKMLTPFKLGAGGRIGNGKQYWSWISIDDAATAIQHALRTESLSGPVNAVAPHPVTNREFTRVLGEVLRRPTLFPMPALAARLALGEMANALLLSSTRVVPRALLDSGFHFRHPTLPEALRHVLGRS